MKDKLSMLKVTAMRTNSVTGISIDVDVLIDQKYCPSLFSWWIKIAFGGVTGYESMEIKGLEKRTKDGWTACAGTKNKWDKLFLPPESMQRIYDWVLETEERRRIES